MLQGLSNGLARVESRLGQFAGSVAYGEETLLGPYIGRPLVSCATKTATFIQNNWRPLIAYVFAWGVIITCTGLMYGFEAVALPLTIGMSCGLFFGVIVGILIVKVFDPSGETTIWNFLNQAIEKLDTNGTRQIILAVAVTVLLAAAVVFPYVIGAIIGLMVGNQLATKAGAGKNLGTDPKKIALEKEALKQRILNMEQEMIAMKSNLEKLYAEPRDADRK